MRFSVSTLLVFMALVAVALATICRPNLKVAEFLRTVTILTGCASLAVGFLSTGKTKRFALTYGIFSLVLLSLEACPNSLASWVSQTATGVSPGARRFSGGRVSSDDLVNASLVLTFTKYWFAVFIAMIAGVITAGVNRLEKTPEEQGDGR